MSNRATILKLQKSTPVKRLLTAKDEEFVKLVAAIIVNKTIKDATHKNGDLLSQVQPQGPKQRKHRAPANDNRPLGNK